jgi:DNA-binding transcriptional MerR regulator
VLEAIIMLKELGMSLKEIQTFLSDRTPKKLLEYLRYLLLQIMI